MSGKLNNMYIK